jgi:hypothetical protein
MFETFREGSQEGENVFNWMGLGSRNGCEWSSRALICPKSAFSLALMWYGGAHICTSISWIAGATWQEENTRSLKNLGKGSHVGPG